MAPVDPQASLSLGPVLDLIERWQQVAGARLDKSPCPCAICVNHQQMMALDIPALRALAEQHAAQLRQRALLLESVFGREGNAAAVALDAAADFLCAPRREPEAE